jgi:hypothetical protein
VISNFHPSGARKADCPLASYISAPKMDELVMKRFDTLAQEPELVESAVESAKKASGDRVPVIESEIKERHGFGEGQRRGTSPHAFPRRGDR